jgi:class 3 adenylate cyclase/tetratricopeptide (TPR) repeat protein
MSTLTLDEIRVFMETRRVSTADLQAVWEMRNRVAWLCDIRIVRWFLKRALDCGELILASEAAREALKLYPQDVFLRQRRALIFAQMGATRKAQELLEAMLGEGVSDAETLSLLGRTYKDDWLARQDKEALRRATDHYRRAFEAGSDEPAYPGINAATLALLGGDTATAHRLAEEVRRICEDNARTKPPDYWNQAALAEALADLGRIDEACEAFHTAVPLAGSEIRNISSTRRQARLISQAVLGRSDAFDCCFPELKLVVFSGHMIDEPGRRPPRFPPEREAEVKASIREWLDRMRAKIGFASAARGADILFLEAMLERGGAVHVVLPWARDRFLETSVHLAGDERGRWPGRFAEALARATSVHELGELNMPGSALGLEYCNLVMTGRARQMAHWLNLDLKPLVCWDGEIGQPGGTGSFADYWKRHGEAVSVIRLPAAPDAQPREELEPAAGDAPGDARGQAVGEPMRQEIKAMLFADIVGYAKMPEEKIPKFVAHFMRSVSRLIDESPDAPIYANTWGDALCFVFDRVDRAGRFALNLRDHVLAMDWSQRGLVWEQAGKQCPLSIRIGLHAGPVYVNFDPVTRQLNFMGAHVNRAARIEPVTEPGHVFASEDFAALAAAEIAQGFSCEFVGTVQLAKNYGMSRLYDLRGGGEIGAGFPLSASAALPSS